MIVQLRDQKLKLFVGLLLILGQGPENCEGQHDCYYCGYYPPADLCDGPSNPNLANKIQCGDHITACFKSDVAGYMKRGCYSNAWAQCIRKAIKSGCYNANVHQHLNEELKECMNRIKHPDDTLDPPSPDEGTVCVCHDTLCNDGPAEVDYGNGTTETPRPGSTGTPANPAGHSTSNGKWIFGFLTAAATIQRIFSDP